MPSGVLRARSVPGRGHYGDVPTTPETGPAPSSPLRRHPSQQRSAERVERMLNACADLLEEEGYDALSTTRIAERAGVAIGSLYQFFPDKRAIAQALTLRHLDLFTRRLSERFAVATFAHWWDAVDAVVDVYVEMHRGARGFRVLHFGDVVDRHLLDSAADNNTVVLDRLRDLLVERLGVPYGPDLDRVLAVAIEAGDAALKLAFRADPAGDPVLINEGKLLIHRYLAGHFSGA